ncbi:MAG: PAS domain-containing sensor histidine kinase [Cellvibrio sp.]|jgi:PAS domain S-box-containing protein|nr:PAS domain-containing sensor histidine kinase [Cellvibrio sp.]
MPNLPDQALFSYIFQQANEACIVVSQDLIIQDINRKACQLISSGRDSLLGISLTSIECALQDIFFWDELNANPHLHISKVIESEWLTHNGTAIPIEKRVEGFQVENTQYWIIFAQDIRERNRIAQEQLSLSSQLQSSLEATAEGIMSIDQHGKLVNINRRLIEMWQLPEDLIVSGNPDAIMLHLQNSLDNADFLQKALSDINQDPEIETEITLQFKDGRYCVFNTKPEYLRDRLIGRVYSLRDITAMKKVEQDLVNALSLAEQAVQEKTFMLDALKMSESRLRRLINSSLIGICQGDMKGQLTLINDALVQLMGLTKADLIQYRLDWLTFTPIEFQQTHQTALQELKTKGQTAPFYAELIHKRGHNIPVMVGLAQLEGSEFEWVGFILDLTEQKKADRLKSEFISVVSHELRTPITSIRGAMSILEQGVAGELTPKALELVAIAHRNSKRLALLVNDILDMEKLLSGKMQFKSESFDLIQLAQQAIDTNATYASALQVSYQLAAHTRIHMVIGDAERTMQVFANLMSNAAKFSPKGEVVTIEISATQQHLRVEVKDKGPGIPAEFRNRIFSKFAQADGTNTRQQGGTGLGLAISKTIIEKMSGEIGFDSEVGKGSTFWFSLPRSHHTESSV